ncbi:MAG: aminomethyl-transferring glycine dehydrogenase, partial [Planktothrix sp.]
MLSSAPKGNGNPPQSQGFAQRHLGPNSVEIQQMLELLGVSSLETLIDQTIPSTIRLNHSLKLPEALSEYAALNQLKAIASQNQVYRSFIGMGYSDCITP